MCRSATRMIAMIATSWAVSTVISIPPLLGLKDPPIDEDRKFNFSGHFSRHPETHPETVGGSFNSPTIDESGRDQESRKDHIDLTMMITANSSVWVNETVTLDNKLCCHRNLDYAVLLLIGSNKNKRSSKEQLRSMIFAVDGL